MRCIKGGHACCYDIPKANIFSIAPATDKTLAKSSDSLNSHFHPTSTSNDHDHSTSFHLRKVQPHFGFGDEEESRSLNHWLLRTSPMLSHYGPMGDFFTIVVPQLAQTSPAIRHMLVSLSMTHEKFMNGVAYASTKSQARALSHYVSAITEIRTNPPSQSHVLAAALLAWTMEMMQNNYPAALVHLKASQSLLRQCESTKRLDKPDANLIHVSLRPTAMLAQGLTAIVLRKGLPTREMEPEYHNHLENPFAGPPFASIADARQEICVYIEKIASLSHSRPDDDAALKDMEIAVSTWLDSVRQRDQETVPSPALVALVLLFNIAMALLPGSDVAGYSYSVNPATIDFVVEKASLLLDATRSNAENMADALETLRPVLEFVVRLFPGAKSHAQALQLLRQVVTSKINQARCKTDQMPPRIGKSSVSADQ